MKINDELKRKLQTEFFEELLPKWDIEKDFLQLGKKYLRKGEYVRAKNIFDDILYVNSDHKIARIYKQFATLVLEREKAGEQIEILNKILIAIDNFLCKKEYGEILNLGDILNDRIEKHEEFYKLQNNVIEAKLYLTFDEFCAAYDNKEWEEVIRLGGQMVALGYSEEVHPIKEKVNEARIEEARKINARANKEYLKKNYDEAINLHNKALKLYKNISTMTDLADAYQKIGEFSKAEDILLEAISFDKKYGTAQSNLIVLFMKQKRFDDAIKIGEDHLQIVPTEYIILSHMVNLYHLTNNPKRSEELLKSAIELIPEDEHLQILLSDVYKRGTKFPEAISILEALNKKHPNNENILYHLGTTYLKSGDYFEAEKILFEGYKVQPTSTHLIINLTYVLLGNMKYSEAEIILEKIIKVFPNEPYLLKNLGCAYTGLHQFEKAERFLQKANKLKPNDWVIVNGFGLCYLEKGEYGKALDMFLKANELIGPDSAINNNLALVYNKIGNKNKTIHHIELARKLDPYNPIIKENYAIIMELQAGQLRSAHTIN